MITSKSINILKFRKIQIQIQVDIQLWLFSRIGHAKDKEVHFLCCDQKGEWQVCKSSSCGSKQLEVGNHYFTNIVPTAIC